MATKNDACLSDTEIKTMHDKAYSGGMVTREQGSDDLVFYWVTQWDDNLLGESQLKYRGEFNIIRKAGRQIMSELAANPISIDFEPVDTKDKNGAEIVDGMYRTDMSKNSSLEAKNNASQEAIVCGVGAWELYNEETLDKRGNLVQVIKRRPLYEAVNNVFWDPNAQALDKADADYVSCLIKYSRDGYKKLHEELTGEEFSVGGASFAHPEQSYVFPWVGGQDEHYYVTRFYHREKKQIKIMIFEDSFGDEEEFEEEKINGEVENELAIKGSNLINEYKINRYIVTRYIVSGHGILEKTIMPGENIPVVPQYGERAYIEGEEYYEGITRLAKDPQRLRNFQMSYLADIVSRSPRQKPIFLQEQIQGFEFMYSESGSENNYPYLLQNMLDANGNPLPYGTVGELPDQKIPQALPASIELSREAVDDVASPGLPQNITDPNLSGKAVTSLQQRLDMQSFIYQENHKTAMRRDGEIYASMAKYIYDTKREVVLTRPDGTRRNEMLMETEFDEETFEQNTKNDISHSAFDVIARIGPAFQSQKAQVREELKEMINGLAPDDPKKNLFTLEYITMLDGVSMADMRSYARKELILSGVKKPETDEEKEMIAQQQQELQNQQDKPDAAMVLAQAEMQKAQADIMKAENDRIKLQIEAAKANQGEAMVIADSAKIASDIRRNEATSMREIAKAESLSAETFEKQLDNLQALTPPEILAEDVA